jgi:hypothetical protein
MRLVIVESQYAGDVEPNTEYARRSVRDSLMRGARRGAHSIASALHATGHLA